MMTQLIEANVPLYIQCLRVPVEWRRAEKRLTVQKNGNLVGLPGLLSVPKPIPRELDSDLLQVRQVGGDVGFFDPWEKRDEFFAIKLGDVDRLLAFMHGVGVFDRLLLERPQRDTEHALVKAGDGLPYEVFFHPTINATDIWEHRRLLEGSLRRQGGTGSYAEFQVRLLRIKGNPRAVLTTTTFVDAIRLTLRIDQVLGAKVQKCARPDCGILFSVTGGHKRKYHDWYCGHIESVRRQRQKAKPTTNHRAKGR
jgi:hypothetical protein